MQERAPQEAPALPLTYEVEIWDEEVFAAALEGVADNLLTENTRSTEAQHARNDLAEKALNLIKAAIASPFSSEARQFDLINQLVSRVGALCNHEHLHALLEDHAASRMTDAAKPHDHKEKPQKTSEPRDTRRVSRRQSAKVVGAFAVSPLFAGLQKYLIGVLPAIFSKEQASNY